MNGEVIMSSPMMVTADFGITLIIKLPRPGRRGSLELAGRHALNLMSKRSGIVGQDDPGELEGRVLLERSTQKSLAPFGVGEKRDGWGAQSPEPLEGGFVHCGP